MSKNIKIIKDFYRLSRVKPFMIFLMFLTLIVPALLSILTPLLVANAITAITVYDYSMAIHQTVLEFCILIVSAVSYFLYHIVSSKINKTIITNFNYYVYEKVKSNKNINSISLAVIKNISSCVKFNKNLIYKTCFFIKSIIILFIITSHNIYLSFAIVIVSIISFYLLNLTNKKIQNKNEQLSKYELESLNLFNSICTGKNAESNYNLESTLKDKYFKYVDENIKTSNSISLYYNINNNFISMILKFAIFFSTIYLIGQVKSTAITLSIYLILTPYLTSSAENLISFFDIFSEIALMDTTLKEFNSLSYIEKAKTESLPEIKSYNLYLYNVKTTKINPALNIKIKYKNPVCFVGNKENGLLDLFNILAKKSKNYEGAVFLDDTNISNYSPQDYHKFIAPITSNEQFFSISIFENLYIVCPNRNKINQTLKNFGLIETIEKLPQKINTIVDGSLDNFLRYVLGVARGVLSGAKIIVIYDYPSDLSKKELVILKNILLQIKKHCTVICFFKSKTFDNFFDEIIFLDKKEK